MTRLVMDYTVCKRGSMEISCRTCAFKQDRGLAYPGCKRGQRIHCLENNYESWVFPAQLFEKDESIKLIGCREVEE